METETKKSKYRWTCAQHGDDCRSYCVSIFEEWNAAGYTPDTVPADEEQFKKCVKWVKR